MSGGPQVKQLKLIFKIRNSRQLIQNTYNIRKYEGNLIIKIKFNRFIKCQVDKSDNQDYFFINKIQIQSGQVEHKSTGHRERITEIGSKTQMLLHN